MPDMLWQSLVQDKTVAADGIESYDLPAGNISAIMITVKGLQDSDEATLAEMKAWLTRVEVIDQEGSPKRFTASNDFIARSMIDTKNAVLPNNTVATDNATRMFSLMMMFGRYAGDPDYAYKNKNKGDASLNLTTDIAVTGADGLILQIDVLELFGVSPKGYFKDSDKTITQSASGEHDIELDSGSPTVDLLLFSTTVVDGTAWTNTLEWLNMILAGQNVWYQKVFWEHMHNVLGFKVSGIQLDRHDVADDMLNLYGLLSVGDPTNPDHWINSKEEDSFKLHINFGDTNAARVIQRTVEKQ